MDQLVLKVHGFEVTLDKKGDDFIITFPNGTISTPNKAMAAKKLGDAIFTVIDEIEALKPPYAEPLELAVLSYVSDLEEACIKHGDRILMDMNAACGCMGPQGTDPLCPCAMRTEARKIVAARKGYLLPS